MQTDPELAQVLDLIQSLPHTFRGATPNQWGGHALAAERK